MDGGGAAGPGGVGGASSFAGAGGALAGSQARDATFEAQNTVADGKWTTVFGFTQEQVCGKSGG